MERDETAICIDVFLDFVEEEAELLLLGINRHQRVAQVVEDADAAGVGERVVLLANTVVEHVRVSLRHTFLLPLPHYRGGEDGRQAANIGRETHLPLRTWLNEAKVSLDWECHDMLRAIVKPG